MFCDSKKEIVIAKIGGMGDTIQLLWLSKALHRKYPDKNIVIYIRDSNIYWHRAAHISRIVITGYCNWNKLVKKESQEFELFFDDRYIVGKYINGKLNLKGEKKERYLNFFNYLNEIQENVLELSAKNLGIKLQESDYDLSYLIENNKLEKIIRKPYILIHNGHDKIRATKSYNKWNKVIELIRENYNIDIIQVGLKKEPRIEKTTDLRGLTNFEELCSLVRGAKLVLTQEGLLAHLAKGYKTKAIVLFGSTPIKCFGYKEHINIEGKLECNGCWYREIDWYRYCPRKKPREVACCDSIRSISPEEIFKEVSNIIK